MKVCIIQPPYSTDFGKLNEYFAWELEALDRCDESMDIIVMPEACDVPCLAKGQEQFEESLELCNEKLLDKAAETARRCKSLLFINATDGECKNRNTTFAYDRQGNIAGKYYKQHLTPGELAGTRKEGGDYSLEYSAPYILELEGLRFAFLTCYDFYFYEMLSNIARQDADIIIGCSHQRSDTKRALELITCFAGYQCNAYVLRSSVSMGEDSETGGCGMVTDPKGNVLLNMGNRIGMECVEINPKDRYFKPAGFGNPPSAHWEYVEKGRRPCKYRPAGSAIIRSDAQLPYPRTCAHRGFNTVAPENSLPAYGAAVALGAEEIEFDLWPTTDGEIVSTHDGSLERTSNGRGLVFEKSYEELAKLDFGASFSPEFEGLGIIRFEDILKKLSCHTIMNIHLKSWRKTEPHRYFTDEELLKIIDLIRQYDCEKHVYFMTGIDELMERLEKLAPDIGRCMGAGDEPWKIVEKGIKYHCGKVQLFKPYFNREMIDRAHAAGMRCNVFWSDDPEETERFLEMGIDTILTNDYLRISKVVEKYK